ncbi:MAG: triose-phosphate isomerase [Bermanella sp.]|jgi:triosephosphate isomerase (EC 5.3.1.1)
MRRKFVAGNWKMHGSLAENQTRLSQLAKGLSQLKTLDMAVFSTAPYLFQCKSLLAATPVKWGAQNISEHAQGAFTGETSVAMLQDFSCDYVIIGHSERRELFAENDAQVAAKFVQAQTGNITPILCVGESLQQREAGTTVEVISRQIQAVLDIVGIQKFAQAVIAYEPIWAIGTGKTATPQQAQEVHSAIRSLLAKNDQCVAQNMQILYGGSVKPGNAAEIFAQPDVDGALVGGASLNAGDFMEICKAAS